MTALVGLTALVPLLGACMAFLFGPRGARAVGWALALSPVRAPRSSVRFQYKAKGTLTTPLPASTKKNSSK